MEKGLLISLEGGEGSGKSTQAHLLADYLEGMGRKVRMVREPGGTELGERVRDLLLRADGVKIFALAELFLYLGSRGQLVEEVIRPSLQEGWIVLCDRYLDATAAYQGYGRGLDVEMIDQMNRAAVGDAVPDLTFLLDLDAKEGLARISRREQDRLESEDLAFHERVRVGYLKIAARNPRRILVVSARREASQIAEEMQGYLHPFLSSASSSSRRNG